MRRGIRGLVLALGLVFTQACSSDPGSVARGPYQTWDEVISRWIGAKKLDLFYELGPPNLHPLEKEDGTTELVWDMTIDRMPGQADEYNLLPLYRTPVSCRLAFLADKDDIIRAGKRIGCD